MGGICYMYGTAQVEFVKKVRESSSLDAVVMFQVEPLSGLSSDTALQTAARGTLYLEPYLPSTYNTWAAGVASGIPHCVHSLEPG